MATTKIRDEKYQIIGELETTREGNVILRTNGGTRIGEYTPGNNVVRDARGTIRGYGQEMLMTLLND